MVLDPLVSYLAFRRTVHILGLRRNDDADFAVDVVVLRHELAVLCRQMKRPALEPADWALLADPGQPIPRAKLNRFFVQPTLSCVEPGAKCPPEIEICEAVRSPDDPNRHCGMPIAFHGTTGTRSRSRPGWREALLAGYDSGPCTRSSSSWSRTSEVLGGPTNPDFRAMTGLAP
jgi:hypothetical protein